ncbi:Serine protease 33 [Orchesella cincta]|uniref:Serine protease 33 n=1 Tax=Orchesella cincta TaxID=48709 RepID=A0A1D2N4B5_ORCCI|nr:Serine protease 33 [Orchesella cincta]
MNSRVPETVILILVFVGIVSGRYVQDVGKFSSSLCGKWRKGRVMGGEQTKYGEFPWITSIQSTGGQHFCAGFMISSRYVISAAHCFSKKYNLHVEYQGNNVNLDSMMVAVNRVKLSNNSDPSKIIAVNKLTLHPNYDDTLNNDIAILELQKEIELNDELNPICLPKMENEDEGSGDVTVAGWGYRHCDSVTTSNELHKITVQLWTADACKNAYKNENYVFNRKDYVCAGSDGKDISKGDSGGPLMHLNSDGRMSAIGIVSSGKFMCSDKVPGIYTKVNITF